MSPEIVLRTATRDELATALAWAGDEGWNPGVDDVGLFWDADPDGFNAAEVDGRLIGTGATVSYGGRLGFMGLFIVDPEHRGAGLGRRLWHYRRDHLISRLEPGAPIGMDGVVEMAPFYTRGGFRHHHYHVRMAGVRDDRALLPDAEVVSASTVPLPSLIDFDADHVGARRDHFLPGWLAQSHGCSVALLDGDAILGLGVRRQCAVGHKIGPLTARSPDAAQALMQSLVAGLAPGEEFFLDIPDINPAAADLARDWEMTEVFRCARMYHGDPPEVDWSEVYGPATLELG